VKGTLNNILTSYTKLLLVDDKAMSSVCGFKSAVELKSTSLFSTISAAAERRLEKLTVVMECGTLYDQLHTV